MPVTTTTRTVAVGAALLSLVLAGCTASPGSAGGSSITAPSASASSSSPRALPVAFVVNPADGAKDVSTTAPISVWASNGTLDTVTVKDAGGVEVAGSLKEGTWTSTERLAPDTAYTIAASGTDTAGGTTTKTTSFHTHVPAVTATYGVLYDGATVGVGAPVTIQFDSAVATPEQRAAVEEALTVTTTPRQEGAWGWLDDRQLMWRPKTYWRPGTKVHVDVPIVGLQTGPDKFVGKSASASFTVGSAMVSTVNMKTHQMTVKRNGTVVKTLPVSTGKPGPETETRSGVKVIIAKVPHMTMDSETIGIKKGEPGYYKIDTDWNLRVTWTGEFLHSAPWSVSAQGNTNVSHGCTNLAPANAKWMFDNSKVGDVVEFTGSSRRFAPTEGIGVWQYSWPQWQAQSALR